MSEIWRCDLRVAVHPNLLSEEVGTAADCGCTDNHQAIAFQIGEAHPTYIGLVAVFLWTVRRRSTVRHATFVQTHEGRTVAVAIVLVRTST